MLAKKLSCVEFLPPEKKKPEQKSQRRRTGNLTGQLRMDGDNRKMYQPTSNVVTMQPGPGSYQTPQKDYLVWSIVNLICCCLPLGLAAVIFSIKTRNAKQQNNPELAAVHSGTAYGLNIAATVTGVLFIILVIISLTLTRF